MNWEELEQAIEEGTPLMWEVARCYAPTLVHAKGMVGGSGTRAVRGISVRVWLWEYATAALGSELRPATAQDLLEYGEP